MSTDTIARERDPSIEACVRVLRETWHGWGEDAHDAVSAWIDCGR